MSIYEENNIKKSVIKDDKETTSLYTEVTEQLTTLIDFNDSVIYLNDDVTGTTLVDLMIKIRAILNNREEGNTDPINLIINSNGGDVYDMLGIIDYIETLDIKVNTICRGRAFSAAAVILACGTGTRMVSKRSCVMFHESSSYLDGVKMSDMTAYINNLKLIEDDVCDVLAKRTKKPAEWWRQQQKTDLFLTANQLLEFGIIDEII
jgi:ATP-dependent Clp protease protease subunit